MDLKDLVSGIVKMIIKHNFLVTRAEPSGEVKNFIDFVRGPKGAKVIELHKAVPVK